jgi:pimeloyl-ACP methyl ester carboxylesterase
MSAVPLAFLPGMSALGRFWHPVAEHLARPTMCFLDWPGLGGNPPDERVQNFDDLASLVRGVLTQPSVLVAQSMGGVIALRVALEVPELVRGLVLTATSGGLDVQTFGAEDWRPLTRASFPSNPEWAYQAPPDLTSRVRTLAAPTLLLWAARDPLSPIAVERRLEALLPSAELRVVDTDDHMFAMTGPTEVAEAIDEFLVQHGW